MKLINTAVLAAAALAVAPAFAGDNPAWTWGQVNYSQASSVDETADSFGIDASMGIADLFHVQVGYFDGDMGASGPESDYDGWRLTAGVHPHIGANTDAVFNIRYTSLDIDDTNEDLNAWGLSAGLRHMLTDKFEINGAINWDRYDIDHDSTDFTITGWTVGGRYLVTPEFSVGVSYSDADVRGAGYGYFGGGSTNIDLRYQFPDFL